MRWMYFLIFIIALKAHAIVIRHDVADKNYLFAAQTDSSTVTFYGIYKGEKIVEGTGTLIADDWIVTAAHVANYLSPGGKVEFKNTSYKIEKVVCHPRWQDKKYPFDIALIKLFTPIKSATIAKLYFADDEAGQTATFLGRGDTGNGIQGITGADGHMRLAENKIIAAEEQWIKFEFDQGEDALPLEGISGPGDSGGPAFVSAQNNLYIVGVSSWQDTEPTKWQEARYGVVENYTRISYFKNWIIETMSGEAFDKDLPSSER
ncbi:S1 family peptidase [Alteromonas ponticola]|uniref:Trypsin-like serine protease n=1 Tax=Alteromonas ponticola TaxID=2720613 RepID=A0ABX1R0I4_9ALTE|nr:trypsin-like serine protease [Alteromonas ponticola]NMH58971.1 trypsin-like serine protease [Alteromonas ponticola]